MFLNIIIALAIGTVFFYCLMTHLAGREKYSILRICDLHAYSIIYTDHGENCTCTYIWDIHLV